MNLGEYRNKLKDNKFPSELSEINLDMSAEYAYLTEQLINILRKKPAIWDGIRYSGTVKSDTAAERLWEKTPEGLDEMALRLELKALDKMMTSSRTRIGVLSGEARNQF